MPRSPPFHATTPEILVTDESIEPLARLEQAINRARQAMPAQGAEAALGKDVATLGDLYGRLIWRGLPGFRLAELEDDEREAFERWKA